MRAVISHRDPGTRTVARTALESVGWEVLEADGPDQVLEACARGDVDVAFLHDVIAKSRPGMLADLKRRPQSFSTAVVVIADRDGTDVAEALEALGLGAQDLLLTPFGRAETIARASAAGRTRALVEELLERDRRIEDLVFVDELTGLYNRRYLLHHMEMLIAAGRRHGHSLGCVLLDVDRFKVINDTHGHPAGDDVLRSVARAVEDRLRVEDVAGRLGGDEILVLLPDTGPEGVRTVAENIRHHVAAGDMRAGGRPIRVSVSVGWVTWQGEDGGDLLQRVDRALYAAKQGGRNRVAAA